MDKNSDNYTNINALVSSERGADARILLHRIVKLLQQLLQNDEPSHIDLGPIKLDQDDLDLLMETLGEGDMYAEIADYGTTRIRQTGIPGVWWVVHLDDEDQVIGEFIEINYAPEALIIPVEDIRDGREALQARLFEVEMKLKRDTRK